MDLIDLDSVCNMNNIIIIIFVILKGLVEFLRSQSKRKICIWLSKNDWSICLNIKLPIFGNSIYFYCVSIVLSFDLVLFSTLFSSSWILACLNSPCMKKNSTSSLDIGSNFFWLKKKVIAFHSVDRKAHWKQHYLFWNEFWWKII